MKNFIIFKIVSLTLLWFSISTTETVQHKRFYQKYPYPVTLSFAQMIANVVVIYQILRLMGMRNLLVEVKHIKYVVCLGCLKLSSSVFSMTSLYLLTVSYSQTLRTLAPVITIGLSKSYYRIVPPLNVYIAIFLICTGVMVSTITELHWSYSGLITSIVMVVCSVVESFYARHHFTKQNMHPLVLLWNIHIIGLILMIPIWLLIDFPFIYKKQATHRNVDFWWKLIFQGFLSSCSHSSKWLLMGIVSPLTYTVVNSGKSIFKLFIGFAVFAKNLNILNILGSFCAVCGVVLYTSVKHKIKKESIE